MRSGLAIGNESVLGLLARLAPDWKRPSDRSPRMATLGYPPQVADSGSWIWARIRPNCDHGVSSIACRYSSRFTVCRCMDSYRQTVFLWTDAKFDDSDRVVG